MRVGCRTQGLGNADVVYYVHTTDATLVQMSECWQAVTLGHTLEASFCPLNHRLPERNDRLSVLFFFQSVSHARRKDHFIISSEQQKKKALHPVSPLKPRGGGVRNTQQEEERPCLFSAHKHKRGSATSNTLQCPASPVGVQFRWNPFSMVAASRRSRMISSEEYSGNLR